MDQRPGSGALYAHSFRDTTFLGRTNCSYCGEFIWGVRKQGRQCSVCHARSHHYCTLQASKYPCEEKACPAAHFKGRLNDERVEKDGHQDASILLRTCEYCGETIYKDGYKCKQCKALIHRPCHLQMAHCRIGGSTRTHIGARGSPSSGALVVPSSLDDNALSPNTARRRYTLPADQQKPVLIPPPAANGATNGHAHTPSRPGSNPLQSFSTPLSFAPLPQPQPLPPPSPQPIRIGLDEFEKDYERLDHLGSGAFGNVYICKQRATGQAYVMKEILKRKFALSKWGAKLQNEYKVMLAVRHPHIVHAIEVFENDVLIQIVMEKADMDLDHYLISNSGTFVRKPDRILRCLFWQMLLAVKYLHDQNITHRDLKGENILLFESDARDLSYPYNAKLADFGVARWLDENGSAATLAGSVAYMAPEVLERSSYNAKVDMWSMGQILSRMYTGKVISKESLDQELSALSLTGTPLPEAVTDLMARLLVVDPDQRWSVDKALDHRWFTEDPNLAV